MGTSPDSSACIQMMRSTHGNLARHDSPARLIFVRISRRCSAKLQVKIGAFCCCPCRRCCCDRLDLRFPRTGVFRNLLCPARFSFVMVKKTALEDVILLRPRRNRLNKTRGVNDKSALRSTSMVEQDRWVRRPRNTSATRHRPSFGRTIAPRTPGARSSCEFRFRGSCPTPIAANYRIARPVEHESLHRRS